MLQALECDRMKQTRRSKRCKAMVEERKREKRDQGSVDKANEEQGGGEAEVTLTEEERRKAIERHREALERLSKL